MNLSSNSKLTGIQAPLLTGSGSTGTPGTLSDSVDMSGFNGCLFTGFVGTVGGTTTTVTLAVFSSTAIGGTYAAIGGASMTSTGGDSDQLMVIDVYKPQDRFLKAGLVRAGINAEYGGTIATQYEPNEVPTVHSTTTLYEVPILSVSITT